MSRRDFKPCWCAAVNFGTASGCPAHPAPQELPEPGGRTPTMRCRSENCNVRVSTQVGTGFCRVHAPEDDASPTDDGRTHYVGDRCPGGHEETPAWCVSAAKACVDADFEGTNTISHDARLIHAAFLASDEGEKAAFWQNASERWRTELESATKFRDAVIASEKLLREAAEARIERLTAYVREQAEWMHLRRIKDPSHDEHSFGAFESCNSLYCVHARAALAATENEDAEKGRERG